jgi:hypothetical protein
MAAISLCSWLMYFLIQEELNPIPVKKLHTASKWKGLRKDNLKMNEIINNLIMPIYSIKVSVNVFQLN